MFLTALLCTAIATIRQMSIKCELVELFLRARRPRIPSARSHPILWRFVSVAIVLTCLLRCAATIHDIQVGTLSGPTGFTIQGAVSNDLSGFSVSGAGDVNKDGIADMIVGTYLTDPVLNGVLRTNAGTAYVIFGRNGASGTSSYADVDLATINSVGSPLGFAIWGPAGAAQSAYSVGAAGDVNADGIGDVIVGAVYGGGVKGASFVVFGRDIASGAASYTNIDLANIASAGSALGFSIVGAALYDLSGCSVSGAGDVNGDGVDDVIVGSMQASPVVGGVTRTAAGISYVLFGRSVASGVAASYANIDLSLLSFVGSPLGFAIFGAVVNDQSGQAVSGAGDVNGDGLADVIVGAYLADPVFGSTNRSDAGISYVIFGRSKALDNPASFVNIDLLLLNTAGSALGFAILGAAPGDWSGSAVNRVGDINQDGLGDIIVSSIRADPMVDRTNAGICYVLFGRRKATDSTGLHTNIDLLPITATASALGFAIWGAVAYDGNGRAVSAAGDVNGDTVPDLFIGASGAFSGAGAAYIIYGHINTPYTNIDLALFAATSSIGYRIIGANTGDNFGVAVAAAGDINKDGIGDIIVGALYADTANRVDNGAAYVIFGAIATPSSQPSSQPSRRPSAQPTRQPSGHPSAQPSSQPSRRPSAQPSVQPSRQPSIQPSTQPSGQPLSRPSAQPSTQPSMQPSSQPSCRPSSQPTAVPSAQSSRQPSTQPSEQPTSRPSMQPSKRPSTQPSSRPTSQPSGLPTQQPTSMPSAQPSAQPSSKPSSKPSAQPSVQPSSVPSTQPSVQPSCIPTAQPSASPSSLPTTLPSVVPSTQPSVQPTNTPSRQPSTQPSDEPSTVPTVTPSPQPTSPPSGVPSAVPSSQPSVQPSSMPSSQPSVSPSAQPTGQPSNQPSAQPVARPTFQPSAQPSNVPFAQPSQQPRTTPSGQPTAAPSARPTLAPTGEWATVVSRTAQLTTVFYPANNVWTCGSTVTSSSTLCVLSNAVTGSLVTQYTFDWASVTSVFATAVVNTVVISGRSTTTIGVMTNEAATCTMTERQLHCAVLSFLDANFLAAAYVSYPNKIVYVGWYNTYTCIIVVDVALGSVQYSNLYTASNMKALTLSQVQSPPNFVGSFVAGTAIRATAVPVNYIVAGMVRTDGGNLRAMILMPQSSDILNSADLVNAMALEFTGPDSFIAGGLQLADVSHQHAYLLRVNALYNTISYCVRYRSLSSGRRALSATGAAAVSQSVVRGMVLVGTTLFMIVDHTSNSNVTSLTVLKNSASNGAILKQVHVSAPNDTNLLCTDIAVSNTFVNIVCTYGHASQTESLLLSVDQALSFAVLPVGFVRSEEAIFEAETIPFQRTVLTVTATATSIATSTYVFNTDSTVPTRRPSFTPSYAPSSQPSSAPSGQPSSSPTAAPSLSARPTSQPSSAVPTNTHKPSAAPTTAPTAKPSATATARPSFRPTVSPSARPTVPPTVVLTVAPTVKPSALPTVTPMARPSARPSAAPTRLPSSAGSNMPSSTPTTTFVIVTSNNSRLPPYVVGASVGAGLGLLLIGYALYQYYQHEEEKKARKVRMVAYFEQQAVLAAQRDADLVKFMQEKADRDVAFRLEQECEEAEKEQRRAERRATRARGKSRVRGSGSGRGAYATGPVAVREEPDIAPEEASDVSSTSAYTVSSMHSSDMSLSSARQESHNDDDDDGDSGSGSVESSESSNDRSDGDSGSEESEADDGTAVGSSTSSDHIGIVYGSGTNDVNNEDADSELHSSELSSESEFAEEMMHASESAGFSMESDSEG